MWFQNQMRQTFQIESTLESLSKGALPYVLVTSTLVKSSLYDVLEILKKATYPLKCKFNNSQSSI
jgi:hypothetical protein